MKFGPFAPAQVEGGILAHSLRLPDGALLRKGIRLGPEEVARLEAAGVETVTVALLEASDVPEDDAARKVARALAGPGTKARGARTGRCNLVATEAGIVTVDVATVRRVNEVHEAVTVSTLLPEAPVRPGELVATVKVIPYAVPGDVVDTCAAAACEAGAALRVEPFGRPRAVLVQTVGPGSSDAVVHRSEAVLRHRMEALGGSLTTMPTVPHAPEEIRRALGEALAVGPDLVLVLGASAVGDRHDVVPAAVRRAGGRVLRLGIPVDPGNLTLLAECGGTPVLGVPGCARSPRRNGFDWILERVVAGRSLEELDVPGLGIGGLLKETPQRPEPRRRPVEARKPRLRVAGVILAAGRSTRMGPVNKLLADVGGEPMVRRVTRTVLGVTAEPVVVVLGHEGAAVKEALEGLDVEFVENPDHGLGMATSVAAGIEAVSGRADGAMIVLGDMPWIGEGDLRALLAAFAPDEGRGICAPVVDRKRGNPIVWAARYFPDLRALEGDVGGRHLLSLYDDDVCEVAVGSEGVLRDVDTPEALDRAPSKET